MTFSINFIFGTIIAFPLKQAVKKPTGDKMALGKFLGSSLSQWLS
jgi:hypothetical protein